MKKREIPRFARNDKRIGALFPQPVKPDSFRELCGTAEAVPYKDFALATQALKPAPHQPVQRTISIPGQQFRTSFSGDSNLLGYIRR
jgi:hypothetical protein